jgi:signal transduction histidine kinase
VDVSQTALRIFGITAVVALPGLAVLALLFGLAESWTAEVGPGMVLLLVGLGTLAWGGVVAGLTARALSRDLRDVVSLAARGGPAAGTPAESGDELSAVQRQLSAALDERNRQIATLAADVAATPITGGPIEVAARVVTVTRQVTGDPTWVLAVLRSSDPETLPPGVYDADPLTPPASVGQHEQWVAVTGESARLQPRHLVGPWGPVVTVDVSSVDELTAILFAPWAGRPEPTPAERDLLSITAQVVASAIEHALLYARLQTQTDELNRLAAVQSDFLRGITHDLQTPLTSIRALADGISREAKLGAQARADLESITHQADRLRRMVGQLLAVSRLEAGALEPRQEVFRVEPIVARTWEALRAEGRPFSLEAEGPAQLIVGDPDRLEQVLWALLDNAVKYSPAESPITVRTGTPTPTEAERLVSPHWAEIAVSDEGAGMSPEVRDRAFDQFFRSEESRRTAPDGSGIGLYAARGLIVAMGGSVQLESEPEAGTTVRIRLPAEPAEEAEAG